MKMHELEKRDCLTAIVFALCKGGKAYLRLPEVEDFDKENPLVLLHDINRLSLGERLLVTITKISDDRGYIRTELDSILPQAA